MIAVAWVLMLGSVAVACVLTDHGTSAAVGFLCGIVFAAGFVLFRSWWSGEDHPGLDRYPRP